MFRPALLFTLAMTAAAGCSSLSRNQCVAGDWETVGYRDGAGGVASSRLLDHHDACVAHGVVPDRNAYLAGWQDGIAQYCQPANGFSLGQRGVAYGNVCPLRLNGAFRAAYQDGQRIYMAHTEVANVQHEISQRQQRLQSIKNELAGIAGSVLDSGSTTADRAQMLLTANDLAQEQGRLNSEIDELERELEYKSERLEDLREGLAYAY